jgi:hypothetical protein
MHAPHEATTSASITPRFRARELLCAVKIRASAVPRAASRPGKSIRNVGVQNGYDKGLYVPSSISTTGGGFHQAHDV